MKKDIYYQSCGTGKIHASIWEPDGEVKCIVQIVHGIAEHVERYADFALYLNQHGCLVAAEDHMGHGLSASSNDLGCFSGGWHSVAKDTQALGKQLRDAYPGVPYVLLGHSMGSFIARTLLTYEDFQADACILSGTAWMPAVVLIAGKLLSGILCKFKGPKARSPFMQNLMFGSYNKRIPNAKTEYDWLTNDPDVVDRYVADPKCGFLVSVGLLKDMLTGLLYIQNKKNLSKMDKGLSVHFVAGEEDPVGNYGNGVKKAVVMFKKSGLSKVTCQLYPGKRHELLNEDIKQQVYADLLRYINTVCEK